MMGLRHTKAVRAAHTRKAVSPSPPRPALQTKWNHGIVPRSALSSITVRIRKLQRLLYCSSFSPPHSPPLFSSSGKHALCSPPGSGACLKTHNGHTTDSSDSCCLPACIFILSNSPLPRYKVDRSTCIPGCTFLVSTKASNSGRSIHYFQHFTCFYTVKPHLLSTPIIAFSFFIRL